MSNDAYDIRNNIYACQHIFENLNLYIRENNVKFTDLEALSLSFNFDELRLLIDTFQKEINSRVNEEVLEKLI